MVLLFGASASGKTEVAKYLYAHFGMVKAITHTTRPMRHGEKQDVDYHFVDESRFASMKEQDAFVETTCYNGYHYGCSKAECGDDKCIVLDPNGVASFLALGDPHIITFYLRAARQTRAKRMDFRGDDPELASQRLVNDDTAFDETHLPHYDFVLDTDEKSVEEIASAVYRLYQRKLNG